MAISLSVVVLLGVILVVMIRSKSIKPGPAIVAALFGFFLASSSVSDDVNRFLESLATTIANIKL
ncbi:hypothetical protein [Streptomyces sp. NPDC012888]|uniref:hypothetical protein n=1 Tax=Streptomyces sp. NPDC012888 TaxID=3364855 RepID=UPI00367B6225